MRRKIIFLVGTLVCALASTLALMLPLTTTTRPVFADSGVLHVAPGGSYSRISPFCGNTQAAVDAAASDDENRVASGIHPGVSARVGLTQTERAETVIFDIDGGRVQDPELWNPYVPGSRLDNGFHQAVIEPLFILNYETGQIEPWLGLSLTPNETMDVWTLVLRDGVKWSDGEDFDADDVVFTIQMLIDNAPALNWSTGIAGSVESVEKVNKTTVNFNLTGPNPRFQLDHFSVRIWGGPSIVPEHIFEGQDPLTFKFHDPTKGWPVFTGPYLVESVSETEFVYVRDDNWWGAQAGWKPLPQPEKLVWVWAGSEEARAALMADGQLDSLMDVTLGTFSTLETQNPNVITWLYEMPYAWLDPCSRTFELNHTVEPWNDKEMRWALNYGIDRDQIVTEAYEGTTIKSRHFFPAYPPLNRYVNLAVDAGLYDAYPLLEYDPNQAREIIESKGYVLNANGYYEKDGKELALDITTHEAFIEKQRIAEVLVTQLRTIGVSATHRTEDGATWGNNFNIGAFEARMGWQTCGSVSDPWASMDTMNTRWLMPVGEHAFKNQWRWSGQAADQYSAIVDEIGTLPPGDPRIDDLFVQATEIYLDELPVVSIVQARKLVPFDTTYWVNWPTVLNNYLHPPTWWQSTHKIIHNLVPASMAPSFPQADPLTGSPLITPTLGVSLDTSRPSFDWHDAEFVTPTLGVSADAFCFSCNWSDADGTLVVVSYTLRIDDDIDIDARTPSSTGFVFTTTVSHYTPTVDLPNGDYIWTVRAHRASGHASDWVAPQRLSIAALTNSIYLPLVLKNF